MFLYRHVLAIDVGSIEQVPRARIPGRVPVVLSREEVGLVMRHVHGPMWLVVALLYGAGSRLQECLELRVKDVDFHRTQIVVRRGKGQKDRRTMLPAAVVPPLQAHLRQVREQHDRDLAEGVGWGGTAVRARSKVPECGDGVGVAVRLSGGADLPRSAVGAAFAISPARVGGAAGGGRSRASVIRLRRICWKTGMTFGRCRNYSAMPMSRRR